MTDQTASAIIALTIATMVGVTAAAILAINRRATRATRRPCDQRGPLDWIPTPHPRRAGGHLTTWTPDDDAIRACFPIGPPPDPDYRPPLTSDQLREQTREWL